MFVLWPNLSNVSAIGPPPHSTEAVCWKAMCLACAVEAPTLVRRRAATQWDQIAKIRQKLDQKNVKLTDHTYACNGLTNFDLNESIEMTRNGNYAKLLKLAWKNS